MTNILNLIINKKLIHFLLVKQLYLENKTYKNNMFCYYIMNNIKLYNKKQLQDII